MKRKNGRGRKKVYKNICSSLLLALLLQTALPADGANEVVKDSGAEECVEIQLPVEKQQQFVSEDEVISVSMPLKTPFTMNPTKSFGEEQIWSPDFHFQNNSQTAVEVTVKNIRYTLKENSTVVTHYQPFDGLETRKKKEIYLCLRFGETEVPVGDLSREYRFTLARAGEGALSSQAFSIEGMMSCYPEQEWQDGDVSIAFQVEYKALSNMQTAAAGEKRAEDKGLDETAKAQTPLEEQAASEKAGVSLPEVKDTEWQKDLIGVVLSEKEFVSTEKTDESGAEDKAQAGADEKTHIRAYIIDSSRTEGEDTGAAQKAGTAGTSSTGAAQGTGASGTTPNTDAAADEEFLFDWKKLLDDYAKYADAIPEGAALLLDVNAAAERPAGYAAKEGLKGLSLVMQDMGEVYAFWRNPDYVPEENKVWHIDEDVPYYISNPDQPWLWSAADGDVPSDAEPVFMWIRKDCMAEASRQTHQSIRTEEGNAEYGPGNNTGDTAVE